jgi:hypothetical protein
VSSGPAGAEAAFTRQLSRYQTELMTRPENLAALMAMPGHWVDLIRRRRYSWHTQFGKGDQPG